VIVHQIPKVHHLQVVRIVLVNQKVKRADPLLLTQRIISQGILPYLPYRSTGLLIRMLVIIDFMTTVAF
jgi:hypothetical protein